MAPADRIADVCGYIAEVTFAQPPPDDGGYNQWNILFCDSQSAYCLERSSHN